jgi:predicted MFS family arabinose efflux permease
MSTTAHAHPSPIPLVWRLTPLRLVWALGLTQIVGYGTLYYAFSVLAPAMARDLAWSVEWVYGAFSAALLVGGLAAPWAGRLIDRRGAGTALVWGSGAVALALALTALAPERITFVAGLIAIEALSTLVLYDAAFAALVQASPATAKRDITRLTLIAGFASTLFWPVTAALDGYFSWREVYFIFALLNVGLCLPLHFWIAKGLRQSKADREEAEHGAARATETLQPLVGQRRRTAFLLVAFGFSLGGFSLTALLVHMLPVLQALGFGASAALVGMFFGPAQVLGRVVNMIFGREVPPVTLAVISSALPPISLVLLLVSGSSLVVGVLFAGLFGLGAGLASIVRGTVPLALFGPEGYGARLGQITAVRLVVTSVAPFAFALGLERIGVYAALIAVAVLGALGALSFVWIACLPRPAARSA